MSRKRLPIWSPFKQATPIPASEQVIERTAKQCGLPLAQVRAVFVERLEDELWKNNRYQVVIDRNPEIGQNWPPMVHLSIKRLDKKPVHDWRDLQRIKNELVGASHEAVELYPAESRLVDSANQYHLWVLAEPDRCFPFGFNERFILKEGNGASRQRAFGSEAR